MMRSSRLLAILLSFTIVAAVLADDAAKTPLPDAAAQAAAMKLVADVYKDDLAQAKKPEEKAALAAKLLQTGIETKEDLAGKYALLTEAKNLAIEAVDPATALAALDDMAKTFQMDLLPAKVEALTKLTKAAHLPADYQTLVAAINPLIDTAIADDDYESATQFTNLALGSARRGEDKAQQNQLAARLAAIAADKAAFARAEQSLATLSANPKDPDANLTVGEFLCFFKGDWDRGLPMLALGKDAVLKKLAELELTNPTVADKQVELADGWWGAAEKETEAGKKQLQLHAIKWYRDALPQLSGLAKFKVEGRIKETEARPKPPPPVVAAAAAVQDLMPTLVGQAFSREDGIITLADPQRVTSSARFKAPVLFKMVVATDSTNVRVAYAADQIIFDWEIQPDELRVDGGPLNGKHKPGAGRIPVNQWVQIDLEVHKNQMVIRVDGQERYRMAGDFSHVEDPISIFPAARSKIKIKSLAVYPLDVPKE